MYQILAYGSQTILNIDAHNYISGTAEGRIAKFLYKQVEYIKC